MAKFSTLSLRRTNLSSQLKPCCNAEQIRHASFLKRPYRPYTFTQLVMLSDGSTFTQRTTSPTAVIKCAKDTRNHYLWQPSLSSLRNLEVDDAGRLRAFRRKFGRGWDVEGAAGDAAKEEGLESQGAAKEDTDILMDLISGYSDSDDPAMSWEKTVKKKPKGEK